MKPCSDRAEGASRLFAFLVSGLIGWLVLAGLGGCGGSGAAPATETAAASAAPTPPAKEKSQSVRTRRGTINLEPDLSVRERRALKRAGKL